MTPETPLEAYPDLAAVLRVPALYFKREDLHPYGSHKGRSIPLMIDTYVRAGDSQFAISSSGNAALAAALHINKLNSDDVRCDPMGDTSTSDSARLSLDIFVGNHISAHKLEKLKNAQHASQGAIRILTKERPLFALNAAVQEGIRSLRQSTDDTSLIGYETLAQEIVEASSAAGKGEKVAAVFIGTSSGTTAQALADYFSKSNVGIQVHIVQTSSCHPLAETFEAYDGPEEDSLADAIVDQTALRRPTLLPLIEKTGGRGWIATNDDIKAAQEMVREHTGVEISTNSALSVAGVMKAGYVGWEMGGAVVCMVCGD
jgi:threonine dehydratase